MDRIGTKEQLGKGSHVHQHVGLLHRIQQLHPLGRKLHLDQQGIESNLFVLQAQDELPAFQFLGNA